MSEEVLTRGHSDHDIYQLPLLQIISLFATYEPLEIKTFRSLNYLTLSSFNYDIDSGVEVKEAWTMVKCRIEGCPYNTNTEVADVDATVADQIELLKLHRPDAHPSCYSPWPRHHSPTVTQSG